MAGIQCPYCRASLALGRIGMHFQKFCNAVATAGARESSMAKFNQFYPSLQAQGRGEITIEELQTEAERIFLTR